MTYPRSSRPPSLIVFDGPSTSKTEHFNTLHLISPQGPIPSPNDLPPTTGRRVIINRPHPFPPVQRKPSPTQQKGSRLDEMSKTHKSSAGRTQEGKVAQNAGKIDQQILKGRENTSNCALTQWLKSLRIPRPERVCRQQYCMVREGNPQYECPLSTITSPDYAVDP